MTDRSVSTHLRRGGAVALAAILALASTAPCDEGGAGAPGVRGIWVSRFNWKSPDEIPAMFEKIAATGFNTVFWQVRGGGTVLYRGDLEPPDERLAGVDASVDPLAIAVAEAHKHGLQLHAWMNCMTGWQGKEPPTDERQLWNAHPDWFAIERPVDPKNVGPLGLKPMLRDGYAFLSPGVPEVRAHLAALAADLVARYEIDGLCLDYIRYEGPTWSWDRPSLTAFRADPAANTVAWAAFRRRQLDETVRAISEAALAVRPGVLLSAATWGNYTDGRERYFQDAHAWLARGWLDFLCPMIYVTDGEAFSTLMEDHLLDARGRAIVPAIGAYLLKGAPEAVATQAAWAIGAGSAGIGLYEYGAIYGSDAQRAMAAGLCEPRVAPPSFPWVGRRVAGDADVVGPFVEEIGSDSPLLKVGVPFRVAALVRDDSGLYRASENPEIPTAPTGRGGDALSAFPSLQHRVGDGDWTLTPLTEMGDGLTTRSLFITADSLPAPADETAISVRAVFHDNDTDDAGSPSRDRARGVSETLTYHPVHPVEEFRFGGFFGRRVAGARHPVLVPGNQLWVISETDASIHAFGMQGAPRPFSPIRQGLAPDGSVVMLESPTSIATTSTGQIVVGDRHGDRTLLLRYTSMGEPEPATALEIAAGDFAFDAIDQLYVTEATRRRWSIYSTDGHKLGGPYSPFPEGDPRAESPSLMGGIAVRPDGRRVYVACSTSRVIDVYELANAPAPAEVEGGPVALMSPQFRCLDRPLCNIGPAGAVIDVAPDGRLFVSNSDHVIHVFDPEGTRRLFDIWSDGPPLRRPAGVAFFPGGEGFFVAAHGGTLAEGGVQLWRRRGPDDPPERE